MCMLRARKNRPVAVSEAELVDMDMCLLKFHKAFQELLARYMPSQAATIKYHKQAHVTDIIRRLGNLMHYAAQFFEADHSRTKTWYRWVMPPLDMISSPCTGNMRHTAIIRLGHKSPHISYTLCCSRVAACT